MREKPSLNATNNDLLLAPTLRVGGREQGAGSSSDNTPIVAATLNPGHEAKYSYAGDGGTLNVVGVRPRRLTPRECERLQGFPDDWTLIAGASDSPRYRVLGNAVAVPVAVTSSICRPLPVWAPVKLKREPILSQNTIPFAKNWTSSSRKSAPLRCRKEP